MAGRILNGRYELIGKVGEGGMAVTWQGKDLLLGRPVAVKVMRESLAADPDFVERFHREAQAAASLQHEHVAATYDFGADNGTHYMVMEYVPGENLRQRLKRAGPMTPLEAIELAIQVAEALEAAHAKGIVHRDVKPANILITQEGQVKVADFGIARALSAMEDTGTGVLLGSVHYMSPEQAREEAVGPQADIYSLGAMLFEALTGRPPFQASTPVAVVHKHIYDSPPSLHSLRQDVPVELEGILLRCLAKELPGRYANARELLTYLRALRNRLAPEGESKPSLPPTSVLAPPKPVRARRRAWLPVTMALVVIAVLALGWGLRRAKVAQVEVPDFSSMDLVSARAVADGMKLQLRQAGEIYSDTIAAGRIAGQNPLPKNSVPVGATVEVQVSLGSETVRVPAVTEMAEAQARQQLAEAGLTVGTIKQEYSDAAHLGVVIDVNPPAGTELPKHSTVALTVGQGPEPPAPPVNPPVGPEPLVTPDNPSNGDNKSTLSFTVPGRNTDDKVEVVVEASDESTRRILYRGMLTPGDQLPTLKLPASRPLTVRIKVDGQVLEEKSYR